MKKNLAISIFCLIAGSSHAQVYGNTWINHSQNYHKFPIHKEGIYRITGATLSNYFDLATINPKNFQLFIKGAEQAIFIKGEANNQLGLNDYLEFYANPGMGDVDSLLYHNISYLTNPYIPLFNDTIYAFLTLNNSLNNKRYKIESDTNTITSSVESYFYSEKVHAIRNGYNSVAEYHANTSDPVYTQGEGYGRFFKKGESTVTNFSNLNPYTAVPQPCYLKIVFGGASYKGSLPFDHQIRSEFTNQSAASVLLKDTVFSGYLPIRQTFTINSQNIGSSTNFSLISVASPSFNAFDNLTFFSYLHFFYPQTLSLANRSSYKLFATNSATAAKGFYNFSNMNFAGTDSVLFYDVTDSRKIKTVRAGNMLRVIIPNGSEKKMCFLAAESQTVNVPVLRKVAQAGSFTNFKDPSVTNPFVIIYHKNTKTGALLYKSHKESNAGGNFNVIAADIDELYEQFGYGINKHPLAIRHFARFLKDSLPVPPRFIFLIGKGVNCIELAPNAFVQTPNMIPTMGVPSSDNLLTSALSATNNNLYFPEIPIGRIAAFTNTDVINYLNKVQQHDTASAADWKKQVLHFVGGNEPILNSYLVGFMNSYAQIIKDTLFGANVTTFSKNTAAPIQNNISDEIKNTINRGAALLTFFGHGSEQGFDQAIDDPEQYNNKGKYPFVVANSCYSGNIHVHSRRSSVSEKFVFSNEKGSIGFLAATSIGFVNPLNTYSSRFYDALAKSKYHAGIGEIVKEACYKTSLLNDKLTNITAMDMTLHGDPSLKISNGLLPDYRLRNSDVSFDLKSYNDSIGIRINYVNLGSAKRDSIFIKIQRYYPNGDSAIFYKRRLGAYYKDSLLFFTEIDFGRGIGLNKFKVVVDFFGEVVESLESNNSTNGTVDIFIPGGDILPVYPYKFAVVPKTSSITLKASTTDPFAPSSTYRFQLDTCDKFLNPLQNSIITSKGGVLEWTANLPFKDSTVYYWRVSRDSTSPGQGYIWKESSFQTIGNKRGWAQAHFDQFQNNKYRFVNYKKNIRQFAFQNTKHSIACRNGLYPHIYSTNISYFFNNMTMSNWGCGPDGWNIAIFDSISGEPFLEKTNNVPGFGEPGVYNNCHCIDEPLPYFAFGHHNYCSIPTWKQDLLNFLNNIPINSYVLAFTVNQTDSNARVSTYSNALYNAFESIGAVTIRNTADTVPYILFGKKGMVAGQGNELKGSHKRAIIQLADSIETHWHSGFVASDLIGPASSWHSLHWRLKSLDATAGDTTVLKLVGIKNNGQMDTLQTFPSDSMDVLKLNHYIDASMYPYIKLIAFMRDNVHRTSPQLSRWQILYDEAPECALNPLKGFRSINDSLQEGDVVTFLFPIENVGVKNFEDSLLITYWIEDQNRNKVPLPYKLKHKPFTPGQLIIDTVKINSHLLVGMNSLWIQVNSIGHVKYQREQYQFNNIGRYHFKVHEDGINPLLDVTFDGIRILNGDIVSARPNILITLKDENQFLALNDTAAFNLFLQRPNQSSSKRIYFGQGLQFTPAQLPKNSCAINYNPAFAEDGKYMLTVQAKDRSSNRSGIQNYQIQFEVNNKPTVTNVLNYPNPFSTNTKFVFTLTGSEVPEVFTIQIMTVSGKLVKEITRSELGHLRIGRNITDYAWDGRDDFGDRLANGVYLYKVVTKLHGNGIEKNANPADRFFVKEFGKMVLMR